MLLSKTKTVLTRKSENFYVPDEQDFTRDHALYLDKRIQEDMGNPDTITITVEPGDTLNSGNES